MTFGTFTGRNGEAKMNESNKDEAIYFGAEVTIGEASMRDKYETSSTEEFFYGLPVDPPWVDFVHYGECEDKRFFQCPECKALIPDSDLNLCECNLKFIPRISECTCDAINDFYLI